MKAIINYGKKNPDKEKLTRVKSTNLNVKH